MKKNNLLLHQILHKYRQQRLRWKEKLLKNLYKSYNQCFNVSLPSLSTIGKADTLYSANILRAVMTGVSGLI